MLQEAVRIVRILLPPSGAVTRDEVESAVDRTLVIPGYEGINRESLINEILAIYSVYQEDFRTIEGKEKQLPWLAEKKAGFPRDGFWNRYRNYLADEKKFPPTPIDKLNHLTDKILDSLFDPTTNNRISKKGLVVGQVQSGKTSNYTGLICKAADAGYKLIIILAGLHNNLRSQTQLRLDEGFLGFDTQHERAFRRDSNKIGVGRINRDLIANSLTQSLEKGDFTTSSFNGLGLNFDTNEPIIAVVKKNSRVLERLLHWLSTQGVPNHEGVRVIRNKSLLLIDDEADNASINTSPETDPATRINSQIRDILRLFDRSGYVGYTATPFANIFIPLEEDNLFPEDFIINIHPPSNYIGPERVFGFSLVEDDEVLDNVLPIVSRIDDFHHSIPNGHRRSDPLPDHLPATLHLAIKCFILTCAIRRLRGQVSVHNSMLVHVTRYTNWQRQVKELVEEAFLYYRRGIEMNISTILDELRQTFEEDNEGYRSFVTTSQQIKDTPSLLELDRHTAVHSWPDVLKHLQEAANRILVKEINGGSADALNYADHPDGLSVIAVGGDELSRGLTLENLSVSYYLRASRMYDTLMQMGRWFGYRGGYLDLCRLFTSRELNQWFCHITHASEELREEFDFMSEVAGSTPRDYALRVRTHPGVLQISASNKIRRAVEVRVSWSGRLAESYVLKKDPAAIQSNLETTVDFIRQLPGAPTQGRRNSYLWHDVSPENIRMFFNRFIIPDSLRSAHPANLLRFINAMTAAGELTSWRVALMSKSQTTVRFSFEKENFTINTGCYERTEDEKNSDSEVYYLKKSHIISPADETIDLTEEELRQALEKTREIWASKAKEGEPSYPSGEAVRAIRMPENPLLLIYFLDPQGAGLPESSSPIIGFAISFPRSPRAITVGYAVHQELLNLYNTDGNDDNQYEDED